MPAVLITLGITLSAVAMDSVLESAERTYRKQKLQERQNYSEHSIYTLFYADSGIPHDIVADIWHEVARVLHVDRGRLRPGDRLVGSLGFYSKLRSSRSDIDTLINIVQRRLVSQKQSLPAHLRTVDDVVRCLAASEMRRCMPLPG